MKKIFLIGMLAISLITSFQLQARTVYTSEHVKIIENLNGDKNKLFIKSMKWAASNFNSAQDVIQYENAEEGEIVIRAVSSPLCDSSVGRLQCGGYSQAQISFNMTIDLKDSRARLNFNNFGYTRFNNSPIDDPTTYKLMINRFESISNNFEKTLKITTQDQDW